jgi:hypothetical protein
LNLEKKININCVKVNKMKTYNYFSIFCLVFSGLMCGCAKYPAYEVTNPPYVNKTSLNMYVGDEVQLTASPVGENFVWSSENEEIASVSRTGLVKALSEGLSSVAVKSSGDEVKVDVRVRTFIPLTDISLSVASMRLYIGDKAQIWAYSVPDNASDVTLAWRSENPDVATVDKNGLVTAVAKGVTTLAISSGSVEKTITVSVPELYKCDKTGWSVEVSDETASDGGGKDKIIDNDYSTGGFWHSQYSGGNVPLPHWAIIDMKAPVEVARIATQRRNNGDTKTIQYFVGDSPDADSDAWVKIIEGMYASSASNHTLTLDAAEPAAGRYLKLVITESYRSVFSAICEVDVYGLMY